MMSPLCHVEFRFSCDKSDKRDEYRITSIHDIRNIQKVLIYGVDRSPNDLKG